ncbi:NADP-dependent phosphogluconate dehydrogenase [Candidatus Peregrinibacteria bacterium]|nr:NADP-dependent phosphogluconate dehydrogenase [Candidatus Peregrinibacteria bacterium]MBI3817001.1 NADP-dependent phosphogluconate dehydrogenase [Candidatus Peregrinibacteria bacterium]
MTSQNLQLGVIGLGTMGANLARNAARNKAKVAVFNRTKEKVDAFMVAHGSEGEFVPFHTLKDFVKALKKPRPILLMVKAGDAVDIVMQELLPFLEKGDILLDGGNSHFRDTQRREKELAEKGIAFLGLGVSGGEEGALHGPSMMPGGDHHAYKKIEPLLKKMAANDGTGGKCVSYLGRGGAGHFVKMVHNGIEYGLMQLIAECYDLMKNIGHSSNEDFAKIFDEWNAAELQSFLIEITAQIFAKKDPETGDSLIDLVSDVAEQKGTGKWTTEAAMDLGVAIPTITAAVDARILSADPLQRKQLNTENPESLPEPYPEQKSIAELCRSALLLSWLATYGQGFGMLMAASKEYQWNLSFPEITRIWGGGCIIRSSLLTRFRDMFAAPDSEKESLKAQILDLARGERQVDWRRLIAIATGSGIPVPALSASLAYADAIRRKRLPQNLIQAQRDFFGAHTFQRIDKEGAFHVEWRN